MRLRWLEVRDFRNHAETSLEVPAGTTVLVGPNAQGKTNLLEAAHYLLTLGSPRTSADQPLIREGADRAFLRGEVETATGRALVEVELRRSGANRVRLNRSVIRRKVDLRHRVRSVLFLPEDLGVVQGDPEERRRFLDECALGLWPRGEGERRAYDRALRQRNRLLKEHEGPGEPADLAAWDAELVRHGAAVTEARREAVGRVAPHAAEIFERVTGDRLQVAYRPSVAGEGSVEAVFRELLALRRADDLARRTTVAGPHRDDLDLAVGERGARRFASHGEAWAAALCLRVGLAAAVGLELDDPPVLLLDDPFSGLDPARRRRLVGALGGRGQVLLSVPDEAHVPPGARVWEVADGRVEAR